MGLISQEQMEKIYLKKNCQNLRIYIIDGLLVKVFADKYGQETRFTISRTIVLVAVVFRYEVDIVKDEAIEWFTTQRFNIANVHQRTTIKRQSMMTYIFSIMCHNSQVEVKNKINHPLPVDCSMTKMV